MNSNEANELFKMAENEAKRLAALLPIVKAIEETPALEVAEMISDQMQLIVLLKEQNKMLKEQNNG